METQAILLLKRLRKLYWDNKVQRQTFYKGNFLNQGAVRADPEGLASGFDEAELWPVVNYLLEQPWHYLQYNFYITSKAEGGWFEITEQGYELTNQEFIPTAVARTSGDEMVRDYDVNRYQMTKQLYGLWNDEMKKGHRGESSPRPVLPCEGVKTALFAVSAETSQAIFRSTSNASKSSTL